MFDKILFLSVKLFGSVKKWSSIENGDRTFPRIYCARNDAAKGPRNASLCECSLDSRTLCSYYHAGLYSAQWSPSRTESFSTRVLSYDIPRPYHIRIPVILLHFIRSNNVFSKKKKNISRNSIYEKSLLEIYFQPVYRVHSFLPFYKLLFLPS